MEPEREGGGMIHDTLIHDTFFLDPTIIQFLSLDFSEISLKPKVPYN